MADVEIQQHEARSLDDDVDTIDAAPETAHKDETQMKDTRDSKEKKVKKPKQEKEDDKKKKKKKRKHDGMNGLEESVKLKKAK